jgi:hypothetical protein
LTLVVGMTMILDDFLRQWWKMTFNLSLKICRFTINIYAWNQLKYTEMSMDK